MIFLCFHARIRKRFNIIFHFQTNEITKRQNQILKYYFKCYADEKQFNWTRFLFLTKFVYNNNHYNIVDFSIFYLFHDFHFEIRWKIENNFLKKKYFSQTSASNYFKLKKTSWTNVCDKQTQIKLNITIKNIFRKITLWINW